MFIFFIGSILASFSYLVAYRWSYETIVTKRSYCTYCHTTLKWHELIPICSFLLLKGRCRYCHMRLDIGLLVSEISGGLLAYYIAHTTLSMPTIITLLFLFLSAQIDYQQHIVPNSWQFCFALICCYYSPNLLIHSLIAIVCLLFFYFYDYLLPNTFGGADAKIICCLCLAHDLQHILCSIFIASLLALVTLIYRKQTKLPFIPFLLLGYFFTTFYHLYTITP